MEVEFAEEKKILKESILKESQEKVIYEYEHVKNVAQRNTQKFESEKHEKITTILAKKKEIKVN